MALCTTAVIPAYNEESRLAETLESLSSIPGLGHLIVVDDGSRDATAGVARRQGAEVIYSSSNGNPGGKGRALLTGLSRAKLQFPDAVLMADADLGSSASRLEALIGALDTTTPVAVARFPPARGAGFGFVKTFSRRGIYVRTGFCAAEPLSGQRALLAGILDEIPGIAPGFGAEVGMTLDFLSSGITPLEVPVPLQHRPTGRNLSGFAHRARQGFDVLRAFRGERLPW